MLCWLNIDPDAPLALRDAPRPTTDVREEQPVRSTFNDPRPQRVHARPLGGQVDYADLPPRHGRHRGE